MRTFAFAVALLSACRSSSSSVAPAPSAAPLEGALEQPAAPQSQADTAQSAEAAHTPEPPVAAAADPAPTGLVNQAPPDSIDVDPQVRELLTDYYHDFASGDWARVAQHFWPEATLVTIRSPGLGATPAVVVMRIDDYVQRHLGDGARSTPLRITLETSRIETFGSVASAIAHYRAVDPSGAESQSWRGADLFSLVRHEGEWRIASLVFEGARFAR